MFVKNELKKISLEQAVRMYKRYGVALECKNGNLCRPVVEQK